MPCGLHQLSTRAATGQQTDSGIRFIKLSQRNKSANVAIRGAKNQALVIEGPRTAFSIHWA
jgi:hypothetical protein